jgi:hypothetical protein
MTTVSILLARRAANGGRGERSPRRDATNGGEHLTAHDHSDPFSIISIDPCDEFSDSSSEVR